MFIEQEKPCIRMFCADGTPEAWKRWLCSGIEEEMIPYELKAISGGEAGELAFSAAQDSRLEVGLSLTAEACALHYRKLHPQRPLFFLGKKDIGEEALRKLGANAARLVKGVSFKE